ncbi:MAG: hypothetical protein KC561_00660 [Myxococcales bacterium]|nr:hypothetical protein [Myxococcales bacterium]
MKPIQSMVAILALALVMSACAKKMSEEEEALVGAFEFVVDQYGAMAGQQRGEATAALIAPQTFERYGEFREAALHMPQDTLQQQTMFFQLTVLSLRATLTAEELEGTDGRGLFILAIDRGMVASSLPAVEVVDVDLQGTEAMATFKIDGYVNEDPVRFVRFEDAWRLDMTSMEPLIERALVALADQQNITIEQLREVALAAVEVRPGVDIWAPLR